MLRNEVDVIRGEKVFESVVEVGRRKSRQLGLYLYICWWRSVHGDGPSFQDIYRYYCKIAGHRVHPHTVRKQLRLLEVKGLVKERGSRYYPLIGDLSAALTLFDLNRSKAGKIGGMARFRQCIRASTGEELDIKIPENLRYYATKVVEKVVELAEKGKREVALDLVCHTLLPLRENGVLWVWWGDSFIYYEPKAKPELHSVKTQLVARLLKELGFEEGIMIDHIKGHEESSKIIHRLFGKGHLSWPWGRSIFYGLKKLGLAGEGEQYIIELFYEDGWLKVILKDLYGNTIKIFEKEWSGELPPPLSEKRHYKSVAIGKQHVYAMNESSYFSRW